MSNTLTNLIPLAYEALDIVSREAVGLIGAVSIDASADTIAKGQTVYSPVAPINTVGDITPAMTVTAASDQTIGTKSLVVDNYKTSGFNWTGEEEFGINSGVRMENIMRDQIAQCLRAHVNAIESAVFVVGKNAASRAVGTTAGTAPILADFAGAQKILTDNGAPLSGRSVVLDTTAGVALRGIANLYKVNEAGDAGLLRNGVLGSLYGFDLRESAGIVAVTAGTGANYLINNGAGYVVGDTALTVDTGTGTLLAGDIITIGAHKYVVATALAANVVTIAAPGLRATVADNATVTLLATSTRNLAFSRNAITLATRLPKFQNGDQAAARSIITDPVSGISFELTMWPGQRMVKYEIAIAYGCTAIKPEHLAVIIG